MLLLLEVVLGIKAFRNGWRWRVLTPFAIAFGTGTFVGVIAAVNGQTVANAAPVGALVEVALIVALALMARRGPAAEVPVDAPLVSAGAAPAAGIHE